MRLIDRTTCVFCSSSNKSETQVTHYKKVGIKPWGGIIFECNDCGSQWTSPVPACEDYERMYRNDYGAQKAGLIRWRRAFPDMMFAKDHIVLEIGGGTKGIREDCRGDYHTWEFSSTATFDGSFDAATDEQLVEAQSLGITDIVSLDCYEHVLDPRQFIINCARILQPGDHLFINHGELKGRYEISRRHGKRQAAHINCPSDEGMAAVLDDMFGVVKGTAGPSAADRDASWIMKRL